MQNWRGLATLQKSKTDDFSSLFQLVKYLFATQKASRLSHFGCALEFVINRVIRKYTEPQADSKAEK
jgi:hypothetical protein